MAEVIQRQHPEITPKFLYSENRGSTALRRLHEYKEAKANGEHTDMWFCDDARLVATYAFGSHKLRPIRTIAAAGKVEPFSNIAQHRSSKQGMVLGHFDSSVQHTDGPLLGCGGLMERAKLNLAGHYETGTAPDFVKHHIDSPDVIFQTLKSASRLATVADKPILAALWDHVTYQVMPIGFFDHNKGIYRGIVPAKDLRDPNSFEGINIMDMIEPLDLRGVLPEELDQLLKNNRRISRRLAEDQGFRDSQKVQDPPLMMITTSVVPFGARYPSLGKPNTVFKVLLPFVKGKETPDTFHLEKKDMELAIAQGHYPISHTNKAQEGQPFANTKTILIETPNIEASNEVASELKKRKWIKEWRSKKGGKILVAQVRSGVTEYVEEV